jgi:hypothetical protein
MTARWWSWSIPARAFPIRPLHSPDVTVLTYKARPEPRDSYQGMPSGMPNERKKARLQPLSYGHPCSPCQPGPCESWSTYVLRHIIGVGKQKLLQSDRAAELFLRVLYDYRAQNKFRLHEFVVMPDHFHVLLTVGSEITIERAVQFIKGGFSFRAGKELGM